VPRPKTHCEALTLGQLAKHWGFGKDREQELVLAGHWLIRVDSLHGIHLGFGRGTVRVKEEELERYVQCYPNNFTTDKDQEAETPQYQDPDGTPVRRFRSSHGASRLLGPGQGSCPAAKPTNTETSLIMYWPLDGRQLNRLGRPNGHKLRLSDAVMYLKPPCQVRGD
jgi:hypothetical protein